MVLRVVLFKIIQVSSNALPKHAGNTDGCMRWVVNRWNRSSMIEQNVARYQWTAVANQRVASCPRKQL